MFKLSRLSERNRRADASLPLDYLKKIRALYRAMVGSPVGSFPERKGVFCTDGKSPKELAREVLVHIREVVAMRDDKARRLEILANPDYVTPKSDQEEEEDQSAQRMPESLEPVDRGESDGDPPSLLVSENSEDDSKENIKEDKVSVALCFSRAHPAFSFADCPFVRQE